MKKKMRERRGSRMKVRQATVTRSGARITREEVKCLIKIHIASRRVTVGASRIRLPTSQIENN
jgi:hypothetical protein